jgi:PIN domain nuclease of toxin-antitoxin system
MRSGSTALLSLREAPLTHEIALATRDIRLPHSDPATALILGLTLVTADCNLAGSKQIPILWNR